MKIQLRKLIQENFLQDGYEHLKRNKGKYALGANAAGIYAAGQGYLGDGAKQLYNKAADKLNQLHDNISSKVKSDEEGDHNDPHPNQQHLQHLQPNENHLNHLNHLDDDHLDHINHLTEATETENPILKHFKDNSGKYIAGEAALLGGTYVAGKGYLGIGPKDAVQDFVGSNAAKLENLANANHIAGSKDAFHEIYSHPDNIFAGSTERAFNNTVQNALQKEHWIGNIQSGAANTLRGIGSMTGNPDEINYTIRNPLESLDHGIGYVAKATHEILN